MRFYAENGKLEDIDAKLRAGADPNATGPGDDRTPLFWAAWGGWGTNMSLGGCWKNRARGISPSESAMGATAFLSSQRAPWRWLTTSGENNPRASQNAAFWWRKRMRVPVTGLG